jgi:hypothetical protein
MAETPPRGGSRVLRSSPPPDESKTLRPTTPPDARTRTMPPPPEGRARTMPPPPEGKVRTMPPSPDARGRSAPPPVGGRSTPPPEEGSSTPAPGSLPASIELERNLYHRVSYLELYRLGVITRCPQQYRGIEDLRWSFERLHHAFEHIQRSRCALLIDSRQAPARNDPEFEKTLAPLRQELLRDFARTAILVQTAVGALQVSRHAKVDALPTGVCSSLGEALTHLGLPRDDRLMAAIELLARPE